MTFNIYDPRGYRIPYQHGENWREIQPSEEGAKLQDFGKPFEQVEDVVHHNREEDKVVVTDSSRHQRLYTGARSILASEIMRRPVVTLRSFTSLTEAAELIEKNRFRHLPVVNEDQHVIGIVSDRGIQQKLLDMARDSNFAHHPRFVLDFMTTNVLCAQPETEISRIAEIFISERVGCMPIVDNDDKLVGILTRTDILRTLIKMAPINLRA